jgi:hypothetical protein
MKLQAASRTMKNFSQDGRNDIYKHITSEHIEKNLSTINLTNINIQIIKNISTNFTISNNHILLNKVCKCILERPYFNLPHQTDQYRARYAYQIMNYHLDFVRIKFISHYINLKKIWDIIKNIRYDKKIRIFELNEFIHLQQHEPYNRAVFKKQKILLNTLIETLTIIEKVSFAHMYQISINSFLKLSPREVCSKSLDEDTVIRYINYYKPFITSKFDQLNILSIWRDNTQKLIDLHQNQIEVHINFNKDYDLLFESEDNEKFFYILFCQFFSII